MLKRCLIKTMSNYFLTHLRSLKYQKNILHKKIDKKILNGNHLFKNFVKNKLLTNKKLFFGLSLATSVWYETNKDEVEENLTYLITLAKFALERGDVERAKDILLLGLQLSEEHKLHNGVPYLYDILAAIALSQGNIVQAQDLLVTAIEKLSIWGYPESHHNIVDFKLRLARIYSALGQNSLAKMGFENCLNHQKTKILDGDTTEKTGILYVNILFWYGVHKIRNNLYLEARDMINTAFDYSTKIKGLSPKQEMIILFTLADLNSELRDFDVALHNMLNAIVIGKGIGSVDLPLCYLKLGTIYEKIGFYAQAKFAYEEALKSAKTYGFFDIVSDAEDALEDLQNYDKE